MITPPAEFYYSVLLPSLVWAAFFLGFLFYISTIPYDESDEVGPPDGQAPPPKVISKKRVQLRRIPLDLNRDTPHDAVKPTCKVLLCYGVDRVVRDEDITQMHDWHRVIAYEVDTSKNPPTSNKEYHSL